MSTVWKNLFTKHLFATNVLTTGGLLAIGDGITQHLEIAYTKSAQSDSVQEQQKYDWSRTGRMFTIGLIFGPFNHVWYTKAIEMVIGRNSHGTRGVVKRILADQIIADPYFNLLFFFGLGVLEGRGYEGGKQEVKDKFLTIYMIDWCVWPPIQFVNFYFLPKQARVVYVSFMTLCWNTFLSWFKHRDQAHKTDNQLKEIPLSLTMGFGSQLYLLLWKNFTLRKRQKYRTFAEIVAPLVLVTILVSVRTRPDLKWYHHECHFDGKAMPSVGIVPFLQSFFCTFNNTCYERVTADEMTGSTANYKDSLLTKLIEDVTDVLNDNVDSKLIKDLIGDWKIISTMAHKIMDGKTVANIQFLTLFSKPQNIVKRIEDNKIPVTPDVLVHLLNASLDFRQMNRPHISDILQDFDVCPRIKNVSPAKSADEVRDLICRSTSMLESLRFQTKRSLQMVKSELCSMPGHQIVQLYEIFKTEYNLKHFVFQVLKFVFLNTGKVPNMMKIYGKLKVLFKDLQALNSTNTDKFRKPLEDLVEFFSHKNNKSNSERMVELLGKFVCGRNSFLKMQSSKSKDLLDRFSSNGRPEFMNQKDGNKNDYGPNSPICMELVDVMNSNVATKVMWKHLRPVVLGKIPYAPDTPAIRRVIKRANQTFSDLAKLVSIAEDWEEYAESVERYLLNSPSIEIIRSFSKSCLCDLVENKTRNFVSSKSKINAQISSKDKGVCNFLQLYLDKESGKNGGFDWKRTLFYTKVFARVVAQYGRCFEFDKFVGYASEAELEENSLGLIENNTFWGALVFDVDPNSADLPTHVKYKIRMDTARVDDTKRVVDKYWRPGPRRRAGTETKYLTYGFAYLQDMVDHAVIKLQTGKRDDTGVILQQFPYPCYIEDSFMEAVAKTLPLFLVLAWIFSVALLCKNIVHEKEKRLKEMMKIMGLGNGVHWLAWFINAFSVMFLTVCLLVTLVKVGKVMEHSDPIILLLFFTSFSIATISQVFLISVFFSQANLAACSAGFLYFIFYQPYSFAKRWEELLTFGQKFAVCLSSNVAFGFGCTYIARFEEQGEGVRWDNIADSPLVDDNFSMLYCILILLLDACIYGLITWYVEAVFPGEYGIPRPFYFFLQRSYWCGPSIDNSDVQEDLIELDDAVGANIEKNPTNGVLGVAIRNLRKVYNNKKVAVDGLNLNFYEGQITSFLGHNGAGKTTTMSILTGLFPPTEGTAYIYGQDITTKMETIRNSLGLCPQYNALFNFLTVEEHLWFYTRLKGLDSEEANRETEQLINDIQLPNKRNAFPKMLSGGMKRKLSVAIAFVGNAKTVILDEPTAGVDPYARRSIWELLLKLKENRTIILSTHHMDEADVLGDRIAIISKGKLCCCGSSLFLKSRYGNGYYLTLVREDAEEIEDADGDEYEMIYENVLPVIRNKRRKPPRHEVDEGFAERTCEGDVGYLMPYPPPDGALRPGFSVKRLSAFIKKYVAKAQLTEDNKAELTYQLPDFGSQTGLFIRLFRELELCHEGLGISSFGISDTSLEEVFLRVAERAGDGIPNLLAILGPTDETKRKRLEEASDGGRVPRPVTQMSFRRNKRKAFLRYPQQQQFVQPLDEDVYLEPMPAAARELGYNQTEIIHEPIPVIEREPGFNHKEQVKLEGRRLLLHHFIAVIIRRFHHFKRSKKGFVCELVMPAFFVLLAMIFAEIDPPFTNSPPLELHPWQLLPPRGSSHLYMFFSNDAVGSEFGDNSVKVLMSKVGIGNRCMDPNIYRISGFPCKNVSENAQWLSDPNPRKKMVVDCSCNTGAQVCPADAGGLEPKKILLPSSDYLYDMTGYNITDWLVKTATDYRKRRYGGISFGVKSQWARASTDHIKQLMKLLTNEMEEEASRHTMKVWTAMEDVMARIASHNISRVWYNNKGWPAVVIYMNVVNNIILRSNLPSYVDPSEFGITTINHPMNMTKQQSQDEARMTSKTDIIISTCVIFAMSFIPASFVMILIEERVSDSKHLQFVSSMSPNIYWLANFVWDMLNYTVSATFCVFIFLAFQRESYVGKDTLPCLIALLLMYGWAMIPVMYPFSRVFRVPSTAMVTLKSVNIFLGTTSTLATFILEFLAEDDATLMEVNDILKEVLLVLPQFCLGQGLLDLSRTQIVTSAFKKYEINANINPMSWSQNGKNLLSMFICGLGFFLINILIENNFFIKKKPKRVPYSEVLDEDADVSRERTRIEMDGAEDDILRIENMSKTYKLPNGKGHHTAVDRLCLGVPKGQCFGLLGVNGAGKTTTFKMLTGHLSMTSGNAYINGFNINTAIDEVRRSIGYCPQFDAFDPLLTAKEILCFYARVKGIPSADVNVVVDWAVKKLGLTQHADRPSGTYSGGNKRKLSTAIALIGNPSVIFLDEPTAGMDPGARRFLWNCINNIVKDGRSVILTSHSMEECEALCGKLAIMVNGRFRCIGSIQHLKTKFGEGYTMILRVAGEQPDMKSLESFIQETFPAAVLREKHHNMLQYQLGAKAQLSQIFGEIEAVKHSFNIEDYSISQTTLDQVFINFAKMQTDMLDTESAEESHDTDDSLESRRTSTTTIGNVSQSGSVANLISVNIPRKS